MSKDPGEADVLNQRWCIVGPTHPFRGGIPRHTTLLGEAVAARNIDLQVITFTRQYPRLLYKGASDRDPGQLPPVGFVPDRMLDSIGPVSWTRTARAIAAANPDVVLAVWWHPFFAPMYGTLLRQVQRRAPEATRLALCHNVLPHETSVVDRVLTRAALAPVDGLVVHAASQREVAAELLGPKPTLVTPHPTYVVDAEVHAPPRSDADGPVTLLFFGLVRPYKGLDVLLRALPAVLRKRHVRLIVAGEFWEPVESYAGLISDLGVGDHVDLRPGYVPESDLVKLLGEADLVVAPYRTATQSGVVEMAFGAGVPVVATRVGGLSEQVDHRVDGLLVEPADEAGLASALIAATEADTLRDLSRAAGSHASGRTWDSMVDAICRFVGTVRDHPAP